MRGLLLALVLLGGCATVAPPVVHPGIVDAAGLERGAGSLSIDGAVGMTPGPVPPPMAALGGLHGEVGLGKRWMLRLDGEGIGVGQRAIGGGRIGLRRTVSGGRASLGMGVGGGGAWYPGQRPAGWIAPDWEIAVGDRLGVVVTGFVMRAGFSVPFEPALHEMALTLSWSTHFHVGFEPREGHTIALVVPAGAAVSPTNGHTTGWLGVGVGYQLRWGGAASPDRAGRATPPR